MFFIVLALSGSGKTTAAQISCSYPIVNYLESKIGDGKQLLVDNSSSCGLFNYFLNEQSVPVMCIDECQGFFGKMIYPSKGANDQALTMERYATPKMFLKKIWGKAVESKNGFADRFMLYYCDRDDVSIVEKEGFSERLDEFPITSLDSVYEKIYAEHNTSDHVEYKLNQSAKECYQRFARHTPENGAEKSDAKVGKNVLKLAFVLHVFYDRLKKALDTTVGTTARIITEDTMKMAISLCSTLSHTVTLKDGEHTIQTGASADEIKQRIVGETADMFTTAKRVYTSFSSIRCRSPAFVIDQFNDLEKEGLGLRRPYTVHPSFSRKFQNPFSMRNTSLESITPPSRYTNNF
ncbi:retinoic acid binding [Desmophyllum pertusum]|uniref:Retinoic acid binding n=1 Tax=Desmophyllum pertusum TaxID=174260 RepID=A0A9W9ZRF1_9CNID|nr:retinoic acid binding [Desmophyllum pertusum]